MHTMNIAPWVLVIALTACSSSSTSGDDASGGSQAGSTQTGSKGGASAGAGGTRSASAGGATARGGAAVSSSTIASSAGGASTQSSTATGGLTATGGATVSVGTTSKGGTTSTGTTAGTSAKGGATSSGGTSAKGGSSSAGGTTSKGGTTSSGGTSAKGGTTSSGGTSAKGGSSSAGGTTSATTTATGGTSSVTLYGTPYTNVNMWYGPVDFSESVYHNGCGQNDGSKYPTVIQNLYGSYLIGLDGENIPNVRSHCDNCAQLTANGKTIVAHVITYGIENGVHAIDLSPSAQTALGLSSSNWTGTWQFSSCPANGAPIYYEFDARQWRDLNFWYMRIWTRNQRLPVTLLESKVGSGAWTTATQASDGAWETPSGIDYSAGFQVRVTAVDKQQLTDTIPAPTGLNPANPVAGHTNF